MLEYKGFTVEKLKRFEEEIAEIYLQGLIHAPCHLEGSLDGKLETWLINFFKDNNINKDTWIFGTHRNHYLWLLSGRDPEELKKQILEGHSMHIFGHKFFTSAIVGGANPIALGVSKALAMKGSKEKVFCFLGDMAASGGLFNESLKYAEGFNLPIVYIILDNGKSVSSSTEHTWGLRNGKNKVTSISYERIYLHGGASKENEQKKFVMF